MDAFLLSSTIERKADKRLRLSWMKKTIPLKNSALFNKAKHSEEWHQSVEATAGVLHPSSPNFPYAFLHNHTDIYLRKKGKIDQADADLRLAILIDAHQARDIGVAAAAHQLSAKSLRALLHAQLNVAQGSYWGLETWLQCLIAANYGNPASVTNLEASWARLLLPYASQGACAAGWYLKGVSRALRKSTIPSLNVLPEFSILVRRAIIDYSAHLEGFRLRCQWVAAHEAVSWMMELERSSPAATPPEHLLPEHIFDSQFPSWTLWAVWRPDINRITRLANSDKTRLATILDLAALEGPDVLTRAQSTLREGLVAQYGVEKRWVRFGKLLIEVPDRTRRGLRRTLERLAKDLETITAGNPSDPGRESMFRLFRDITVNHPITEEGLDIFEATVKVGYTPENNIYETVREINNERDSLGGQHILALQNLIRILDEPQAEDLRLVLLHPWLLRGIERSLRDCRAVIRAHMDGYLPWIRLAVEIHAFYITVKNSPLSYHATAPYIKTFLEYLPPVEQMSMVQDIYVAAQSQRPKPLGTPPQQDTNTSKDDRIKRASAPSSLLVGREKIHHPLESVIESFCICRLLEPGKMSVIDQRTITAILHVWERTSEPNVDNDRRSLAILVSRSTGDDHVLRCRCLTEIAQGNKLLETTTFVKDLLIVMHQADLEPERAIIEFTKLLAVRKVWTQCWRDLLYRWLEQIHEPGVSEETLIKYSLRTMKAANWLHFMHSLETLFTDLHFSNSEERQIPSILQPQLLSWKTQVSRYTSTLTRLEDALADLDAVRCILICGEGFWTKNLLTILECLERAEGKPAENLMQQVVGKLSAKTKNAWEVKECLFDLLNARPEAIQACGKIWDAKHGFLDIPGLPEQMQASESVRSWGRSFFGMAVSIQTTASPQPASQLTIHPSQSSPTPVAVPKIDVPLSVAEVMVAGWVQDDAMDALEKVAIGSVACLLNLEVYRHAIPSDKLLESTVFWENIEREIINEAERLEALQKALKAKDPKGTTILLEELGVPDNSLLDEEILTLPAGVSDVVERVGDDEIEISFPLTAYTELQRGAMGISKTANTVVLRLFIDNSGAIPSSFCMHFDNDVNLDTLEHSPWICSHDSMSPQEHICKSVQTAFTWQLNRILHTQLMIGNSGIANLHRLVKTRIEEMGQSCISCGTPHNAKNAQLRRSTPCDVISCARLWYQLPLDVRIPEIRTDTFAVDVMLTSVYAAAMSSRPELLPGCPIYGNEAVKAILNSLPSLTVLSHAVHLSTVLKSYHKDAEKLISWACVHFRGYLATATGICKIPNLPPGTHQFVLVNASPRLESDFVTKLPKYNPKTMVLFHGTSLDRLPAILAQGLKICSGTSLQRTGAAHGKGIYMAEDPATSFTYSPSSLSWRNSALPNMRLMLGCEVVGNGRSVSPGIHVITDEKSVMVRYVFMFTNYAKSPIANHVIPAMMSGMIALRTGAV